MGVAGPSNPQQQGQVARVGEVFVNLSPVITTLSHPDIHSTFGNWAHDLIPGNCQFFEDCKKTLGGLVRGLHW
ncbi:hypothetical protein chiPu_0008556 [Chiloscyllium punctatum]|uniref:Uncharacterized protein n=1 Tax=Chiloscyllium punctatum TaxID=137246 RepID=A0A401SID5_CHIPU|nr:hypothetical protein [Chiloscyllium punctatum]